jgi:putative ABC transport system permease protein
MMPIYLALKETWRSRGRFLLFSLVIALITTLVLFIAALAGGLATANRQFIEKLDADLLVYQENSDLQATSSRLGLSKERELRRVEGVKETGALGFSSGTLLLPGQEQVDVALVGVEPGKPGDPQLLSGPGLRNARGKDVIIDQQLARSSGLQVGDWLTIQTVQGTKEESYKLQVAGITDQRQYFFQPSLIMPINTWDEVRPQAAGETRRGEVIANVFAVQLVDPKQTEAVSAAIDRTVNGVESADKQTAILAIPGYTAQQSTLNTQQGFTLFIGVLVVGGFFQIQMLQKVPQIGMLKAIGTPNRVVAAAALLQIIAVTVIGVAIGGLGTFLLTLAMPDNIPILFTGISVLVAIALLLLIGPLGGLVSIRLATKIEPLTAIGLAK